MGVADTGLNDKNVDVCIFGKTTHDRVASRATPNDNKVKVSPVIHHSQGYEGYDSQ
jgi:hypothetical protein